MSGQSGDKPERLTIRQIPSQDFRIVYADDATVNAKTDRLGTIFQLNFTRLEMTPTEEEIPIERIGDTIKQIGSAEFKGTEVRKIQEVGVLLRPDNAFAIANAIYTRLSKMTDEQRKRYNIPAIEPLQVKEAKTGADR